MFLFWIRQLPWCGDWTPASVLPLTEGRSSPTKTPVLPLVPSSYWVLCGSIHSFPLVRYSCPLSAGVLLAFLCLKVYPSCICGERCTPCPPTPLPSCSPCFYSLIDCQPLTFERLHVVIQVSVVSRKFGIEPLTSLPTWQHLVVFRQILCSPVFHSVSQQASSGTSRAGPVGIELSYLVLQYVAIELRCYISLLIPFFLRKTANFCKY